MSDDRPGTKDRPGTDDGEPEGRHMWGFLLRVLVPVAAIGISSAALWNVFSDASHVQHMAMAKACAEQAPPCRAELTRWERSAIAQTYHLHTPSGTVVVRCQRELFLVGKYHCTLRDSAPPAITAEPPAPAPRPSAPATAKPAPPAAQP